MGRLWAIRVKRSDDMNTQKATDHGRCQTNTGLDNCRSDPLTLNGGSIQKGVLERNGIEKKQWLT